MVFVTGGTGFLGAHVLVELVKRGHSIRALYRSADKIEQTKQIFQHYFNENATSAFDQITWVSGDILDIISLEDGIEGCDTVYHCAGLVSFRKRDFKRLMKVNKEGTANVVNVALEKGVQVFVILVPPLPLAKPT